MSELDHAGLAQHGDRYRRRVVVILEDVRSRHNVGSVFRTADAFGSERVILCGFTPVPPHRDIEKSALGATLSVPWEQVADAAGAVSHLQAQGYQVFAVEQTLNAAPLHMAMEADAGPIAVVFGNELEGVSQAVIEACDACLVIPQYGTKHSLNVSVCVGVVLWSLVGASNKRS